MARSILINSFLDKPEVEVRVEKGSVYTEEGQVGNYKLNSWNKLRKEFEVFVTNLNFIMPIFLYPDGGNLWYFKLRLFDLTELIISNI